MNIYAIGDLHLSGQSPKPMDIFGDHWTDHWPRIKESWQQAVSGDDVVLIPGDISWAMRLEEARCDLDAIGALPGRKIIMRGNHDYWWGSLSQVQSLLPPLMYALQNNSFVFEDCVIGGTRGWLCPGNHYFSAPSDEKIYLREAGRLELSLAHARKTGAARTPDRHDSLSPVRPIRQPNVFLRTCSKNTARKLWSMAISTPAASAAR